MSLMASTNATKPTTTISCDEKDDIDFMFQSEVELEPHEASNYVEIDVVWDVITLKLLDNQSVRFHNHRSLV
jgi:hypothetical protein